MRLLVCGSRTWSDRAMIRQVISDLSPSVVIDGGARGADRIANGIVRELGIETLTFRARWDEYGRAAGMIRNRQMIGDGRPDMGAAFWNGRSRGTRDMIRRLQGVGIPALIYTVAVGLTGTLPQNRKK